MGTESHAIELFTIEGKRICALPPTRTEVQALAWSMDDEIVAVGTKDGIVQLWRASSGCPSYRLPIDSAECRRILFGRNGRWLFAGGAYNSMRLEKTGTLIWMQFAHYLLARAFVAVHQWAKAADIVDRLLAEIGAAGGRWYEAEVHHLRGDILRGQHKPMPEIEACYESAIAIARRQGARMWELKAVESLDALREAGTGRTAGAKQKPSVKI